MRPTTWSCTPRHGHAPHDMSGTHDMVKPCRVGHVTMSCGTCTHDMVMHHTTWSCTTRYDHVVWNIEHVPHDMIKIPHGMPTRHGHAPHDMVMRHTVCPHDMIMSCGKSDHVVCAPCRVERLTLPCGVLGLPMWQPQKDFTTPFARSFVGII